jgi:hypothetical protein
VAVVVAVDSTVVLSVVVAVEVCEVEWQY